MMWRVRISTHKDKWDWLIEGWFVQHDHSSSIYAMTPRPLEECLTKVHHITQNLRLGYTKEDFQLICLDGDLTIPGDLL